MSTNIQWSKLCLPVAMALYLGLALPGFRQLLEATLIRHMLVQMPLLGLLGYVIGVSSRTIAHDHLLVWDQGGATGLLFFVFISTFWMLPRSVDAALIDYRYELAKFAGLPFAGVLLAWSYPRAHVIVRGVLLAHVVSAFWAMSWVYLAAPERLCNSYERADQDAVGASLMAIGIMMSLYLGLQLLFAPFAPAIPCTTLPVPCSPSADT